MFYFVALRHILQHSGLYTTNTHLSIYIKLYKTFFDLNLPCSPSPLIQLAVFVSWRIPPKSHLTISPSPPVMSLPESGDGDEQFFHLVLDSNFVHRLMVPSLVTLIALPVFLFFPWLFRLITARISGSARIPLAR